MRFLLLSLVLFSSAFSYDTLYNKQLVRLAHAQRTVEGITTNLYFAKSQSSGRFYLAASNEGTPRNLEVGHAIYIEFTRRNSDSLVSAFSQVEDLNSKDFSEAGKVLLSPANFFSPDILQYNPGRGRWAISNQPTQVFATYSIDASGARAFAFILRPQATKEMLVILYAKDIPPIANAMKMAASKWTQPTQQIAQQINESLKGRPLSERKAIPKEKRGVAGIGVKGIARAQNPTELYRLVVMKIVPNSPAENVGMSIGDTIISIDGVDVSSLSSMDDAFGMLTGYPGETVQFEFIPVGEQEMRKIELKRDNR